MVNTVGWSAEEIFDAAKNLTNKTGEQMPFDDDPETDTPVARVPPTPLYL